MDNVALEFECPKCGGHTAVRFWVDHNDIMACSEKNLAYRDASVWDECTGAVAGKRCGLRRRVATREIRWSYLAEPPTRTTRLIGPDGAVLSMKIETVEDVA